MGHALEQMEALGHPGWMRFPVRAWAASACRCYQARLDQAENEPHQVWAAMQIITRQLQDIQARLPGLERKVLATEQNFQQGTVEAAAYSNLKLSFQTEQMNAIRLRLELEKAEGALQLVLGLPLDSDPS